MRISKSRLRRIIAEEVKRLDEEAPSVSENELLNYFDNSGVVDSIKKVCDSMDMMELSEDEIKKLVMRALAKAVEKAR